MAIKISINDEIRKLNKSLTQEIRDIINADATIYAVDPESIIELLEDVKAEVLYLWEQVKEPRQKRIRSAALSVTETGTVIDKAFYDTVKSWKITRKTARVINNKIAAILHKRFSNFSKVQLLEYGMSGDVHYFILISNNRADIYRSIQGAYSSIREVLNTQKFQDELKLKSKNTITQLIAALKYSDIGHERSAAEVASDKLYDAIKASDPNLSLQFQPYKKAVKDVGIEYSLIQGYNKLLVDIAKGAVGGVHITTVRLQSRLANLEESNKLNVAITKFLNKVEEVVEKDLIISTNSKSIEDTIADDIIAITKGKRTKPLRKGNSKKTTKGKIQGKPNRNEAITTKIILKPKKARLKTATKLIKDKLVSDDGKDLNKKIPYLNRRLHDKIQQNMGKGGSKEILNYRTGRFARSAEIQQFLPSRQKSAIRAQVKYMRYPYGTFEPGGRLHKPGRDPHRIFARSIRQLLQEEKIAKLRRVMVDLNG